MEHLHEHRTNKKYKFILCNAVWGTKDTQEPTLILAFEGDNFIYDFL